MAGQVTVITHPLVQHKLTIMRKKSTSSGKFRRLAGEIAMLLAYEVTRDMPTVLEEIETPLCKTKAPVLKGREIVLISILRAGNGILDGMLRLIPTRQPRKTVVAGSGVGCGESGCSSPGWRSSLASAG